MRIKSREITGVCIRPYDYIKNTLLNLYPISTTDPDYWDRSTLYTY
jgi:hypothetical protein